MKLSVIIVNYNVSHFLEQCLISVRHALKYCSAEVFVVDNNSVDNSVDMVKQKFPEVILIENKVNTGFSKANNQAMRIAKGEYVLLLNPDTIVQEDTFEKCIQFMDAHPDAGALGVQMIDGSGKFLPESKRGLPTPWVAFYKVFGLAALFPKSTIFGKYHLGFLDQNKNHSVEILSGAYMFMRKAALDKVGLLDEAFFMYGEDIDLSYRFIKGGYENYYLADTKIIHYKGESTKKTSVNYVFVFYKAMIIFARKHFSQKHAGIFSLLINMAIWMRAGLSLIARFVKASLLPLMDSVLIAAGFYWIQDFWEKNYKKEPGLFPDTLLSVVLPIYICIWLLSVYFYHGYTKRFKWKNLFLGILAGAVMISVVTNFIEDIRFSKALILLGSVWAFIALLINRSLITSYRVKKITFWNVPKKNILIVGSAKESTKIMKLLQQNNYPIHVSGFVDSLHPAVKANEAIGTFEQLNEIITIYKIDELIFCSSDIPSHEIIRCMSTIYNRAVSYKIVSDGGEYMVGSSSKDLQGDVYTLSIRMGIYDEDNVRNKRLLDLSLSVLFLIASPLLMWFTNKPSMFLQNIVRVLSGEYSWVGYSKNISVSLPTLKKGIVSPDVSQKLNDVQTLNKLNFSYARDYSVFKDLKYIFSSFKMLGN